MVIVSSGLGTLPVAGCITYSASKAFISFLSQGLSVEYKDKIDVMCYHAGMIKTKLLMALDDDMTNNSMMVIQPDTSAKVCFRDIGIDECTKGHIKHSAPMFPGDIFSKMMYKVS